MKAVLPYKTGTQLSNRLSQCDDLDVVAVDPGDEERLRFELRDAEVLLHVLAPVTSQVISLGPNLRLIQKIGVGTDTIDVGAVRAAGIAVTNMPDTNTHAVAEHTLSLILATLRKIVQFHDSLLSGRGWNWAAEAIDPACELNGRTVGLIGFGAVPSRLARVLKVLGCEVVFFSRSPRDSDIGRQVTLGNLLENSDIVSLHLPFTPETRHLINDDAMARMTIGAVLINTARGGLVDEKSLVKMLHSGHLSAAGLDVFEDESIHEMRDLLACPTVTLTPHVAWLTTETIERSLSVIVENTRRLKLGLSLIHQVT